MNPAQLVRLGLTESLANAYVTLLENGKMRPPELAKLTNESRTNAYSLLDKLVELKLARREEHGKKIVYEAENPVALEHYIANQRQEIESRERAAKALLPELLNLYQTSSEKPGVRFYEGKDGIREIYEEEIREGEPIEYIRTRADIEFLGYTFTHNIRMMAPNANIQRHVFALDSPEVPINHHETDKKHLLTRTWLKPDDYTAPVEWSVFGNKVAAISFGKEAIGMVIDSPQIAESMRQIFKLLDEGLHQRSDYNSLPKLAAFKTMESFVKKYNDGLPPTKNTSKQ